MSASDRRWHDCNSGTDSAVLVWRLEGNQVLYCAASAGVGILLFRLLHGTFGYTFLSAGGLALIPFVATTAFTLTLRTGKPPSYAAEFLELQSQHLAGWLAQRFGTRTPRSAIGKRDRSLPHPALED